MIKNYKNKKFKKAAKVAPKILLLMKQQSEKEKTRVNLKDRVEDNICDLSASALDEVPVRAIAALKCILILNLSSNNLTFLSRNFCLMLTRLTSLDLSQNHLSNLPDDFGALINLRHLDLNDNKLQHLPLSFGNLINLQYLNLKDNPLSPIFVKIVGACLTYEDCEESARHTVSLMATMQLENKRYLKNAGEFVYGTSILEHEDDGLKVLNEEDTLSKMLVFPLPRSKKRNKNKQKKKAATQISTTVSKDKFSDILANASTTKVHDITNKQQQQNEQNKNYDNRKIQRGRKKTGWLQYMQRRYIKRYVSSTVLRSIVTFFILLAINIFVIYMIMFKNPEMAVKMVEVIPQQYREWIVAKTEIFRVNIGDWIADFLTPPDEQ